MNFEEKWRLLLEYAENFPVNDFTGFTNIMSLDSRYIRVSDNELPVIGYKNHDQVYATDYYNMPCHACENAATWIKEDQISIEHEIKVLSYHLFANDWMILLGQKKPIVRQNEVIGTLQNYMDITQSGIIDMARYLLKNGCKIIKKSIQLCDSKPRLFSGVN